ncbi:MAG: class II fructose-bisphosphate aldolase [Clostridia bacterium]|nr:class II fructose-bisphosphate aldolase [Clostridia bacterium]
MSLVSIKNMLQKAQEEKYAVGTFNVENMEMIQAVIGAAEELKAPVILQTTPSTLKYANPELFFANVSVLASQTEIPIAIHLDHGDSFEIVTKAFRAGYTSVMIDGSKYSLDENVKLTKKVVDLCSPLKVSVEAELGSIGGKEDSLAAENIYTRPEEAAFFVSETKIDALAVAIGTAHGVYKSKPKIDIDRLKEIHQLVDVPLVLHGTSGVPDEIVMQCIENGICKVNYATDLRVAFTKGVTSLLQEDNEVYDPKKYITKAREEVKNYVTRIIKVCGCAGKAI